MRLSAVTLFIFCWTSLAWANDQQASISIPKIGRVIITAHVDRSPALASPFLTIENPEGKMLKRINFKLEGVYAVTLYPSLLNFKVIHPEKESVPVLTAVASSIGGSDIHFETTLIGFLNGEISELTPEHIESSSQDARCLENPVAGRPSRFILFNFLWEEAHYDPHRYEATLYEWAGNKLNKISLKQTKKRHKGWKGAAAELGYHCREDLIQTTNPHYK